ncbi:AraC family transcriptional regulator [filamentous cyanobacterium CCT1]|nr:AraC family transcriptional regulator [filamentous cyanobacterium CCT1]
MSLDLTAQEANAIWAEAKRLYPPATSIDRLETIYTVPPKLGMGFQREIDLCSGLELCIINRTSQGWTQRVPENEHPVQFAAYLSGAFDSGNLALINAEQGYVGGSGIQPSHSVHCLRSHPQVGVNIHLAPALFHQQFATPQGTLPADLQPLVQGSDWQQRFSPKMTAAIRLVVQQIIDCPFLGTAKRIYLQGKVFELMALQLDGLLNEPEASAATSLKPDTVARIHYAAEILCAQLENPPNQTALAQQVGMSDRTLQKGFKAVFGVTPFAYLTQQRMQQAEQLLRQPNSTVAEVATTVGYANPAQFAAAFKRQFGISPSECLRGKKMAQISLLG